jgi:hypothetical protein
MQQTFQAQRATTTRLHVVLNPVAVKKGQGVFVFGVDKGKVDVNSPYTFCDLHGGLNLRKRELVCPGHELHEPRDLLKALP